MSDIPGLREVGASPPENLDKLSRDAPWVAGLKEVQGTASGTERASAFAKGFTGGVVEVTPTLAGAGMGASIGTKAGAVAGPFGSLVGGVAGAVVGGASGYFFGSAVKSQLAQVEVPWTGDTLVYENMQSVPKHLRPWAMSGETLGASVPFTGAPYALVRGGVKFGSNLPGRIMQSLTEGAATAPYPFAVKEMAMASGASFGAGVAQDAFPDQPAARITGEFIGGMFNPTRWTIGAAQAVWKQGKNFLSSLSKTGTESRAARILQERLLAAGEDPKAIAAEIRSLVEEFPELSATTAQLVDSPALRALENRIIKDSSEFGLASEEAANDSLLVLKTMINVLEGSGNPQLMREAANMRRTYFNGLLAARIQSAENAAIAAAADIDPSNTISSAEYGRRVTEIMDAALDDVRQIESALWGRVDKDIPVTTDSIIARYESLRGERLPEEPFPHIVEGAVRRWKGEPPESEFPEEITHMLREVFGASAPARDIPNVQATTGELLRFRSRMLALSREAAARNEFSDAAVYGQMAEAALDDLARVSDEIPELGTAREYSRQLHDTFSRTFAHKTAETGRLGEARIPPELVMRRAFSGGKETGDLRFAELEAAARMAGDEHLSRVLDTQERMLNHLAAELIDPATGLVNQARLERFRKNNAGLLRRFPEVDSRIANAAEAQRHLSRWQSVGQHGRRAIEQRAAFSMVLKGEDPIHAVNRALTGDNPQRDFRALLRLSRRIPEGEAALRKSIFSWLGSKSSSGGEFSFETFTRLMREPLVTGGPTLETLLISNKLFSPKEAERLTALFDRAATIERAVKSGKPVAEQMTVDMGWSLILRSLGSKLGTLIPGRKTLIAQAGAAKYVERVFDKIPTDKIGLVWMEAAKNPEFMATLLEKPGPIAQQIVRARQINAYLWQMGITAWPDNDE